MPQTSNIQDENMQISREIFNKVFSKDTDVATFHYKHYQNPYKVPIPVFTEAVNGMIAGVNCFMGAKCIIQMKEVFAAQSCDSAVLPEFRGKGVFSRIIRSAEKQCEEDGVSFLFGFPNDKSYPGFMKLGWVHVADFYRAILPLDTCKLMENKINKQIPRFIGKLGDFYFQLKLRNSFKKPDRKITIERYETCPFTEKEFKMINHVGGVMIKRSSEYYQWKLDNNPSKTFIYMVARDENDLLGFIIYRSLDGSVDIVDWLCFESDPERRKILLAKMFWELRSQGIAIHIQLVNKASDEMKLLESLGFISASNLLMRKHHLPLIVKVFHHDLEPLLLDANKWICRSIDTDLMIS